MQIIHPFNSTLNRNDQQAIKAKAKSGSHVTLFCYLKHFLNLRWKIKKSIALFSDKPSTFSISHSF